MGRVSSYHDALFLKLHLIRYRKDLYSHTQFAFNMCIEVATWFTRMVQIVHTSSPDFTMYRHPRLAWKYRSIFMTGYLWWWWWCSLRISMQKNGIHFLFTDTNYYSRSSAGTPDQNTAPISFDGSRPCAWFPLCKQEEGSKIRRF